MAGSGAIKRKSIQKRLREIRAQAVQELTWTPTPAWFIGGEVDILLPVEDVDLTSITKAEYLAALTAAVEDRELGRDYLEADRVALSWARFVAWREGDHGPHIDAAKQPAPSSPQPTVPAAEDGLYESGPRQRRDLEAERARDDEREFERQRLLRIANEAGPRWFTT
jgi:hypothetical protein